ncbi:MAG: hypothetical protein M9932_04195 [Xanthobacteraceae bacterium]|nr:hypothetical protein [Xanthobacteraceae bacterium]
MGTRRFTLNVVTAADGTATAYSPFLSGKICAIHYIKTDYAAGVDFTITAEATGEGIWTENDVNASKSCYPRAGTHSNAGVAALYAASGTGVNDLIRLSRDRVKIALAQGGNAKSGQFQIVVED